MNTQKRRTIKKRSRCSTIRNKAKTLKKGYKCRKCKNTKKCCKIMGG